LPISSSVSQIKLSQWHTIPAYKIKIEARPWLGVSKSEGKRLSIWRKTTCRGRLTDVAVRRPVTRSGGRLATMTQSTLATRIIIRFNTVPGPFLPALALRFTFHLIFICPWADYP
jgi:hypothetical protein